MLSKRFIVPLVVALGIGLPHQTVLAQQEVYGNGSPDQYQPLSPARLKELQKWNQKIQAGANTAMSVSELQSALLEGSMIPRQNLERTGVTLDAPRADSSRPSAIPIPAEPKTGKAPRANKSARKSASPPVAQDTAPAIPVTACGQTIQGPGTYILTADLSSQATCLKIENTDHVRLLCDGHSITAKGSLSVVLINAAPDTTLEGCAITGNSYSSLWISDSDNFKLKNNVNIDNVIVQNSQHGKVIGNTFTGHYLQFGCSNTTIIHNVTKAGPDINSYAAFYSRDGSHNVIAHNTIDGSWPGTTETYAKAGFDSGVILGYETGDCVIDNTIANCWNTGIETLGDTRDLKISQNKISQTQTSAIGAFWNTSWSNVTVQDNEAADVPAFFINNYVQGDQFGPKPDVLSFENVQIKDNQLSSPRPSQSGVLNDAIFIYMPNSSIPAFNTVISGNSLSGNRFATSILGPVLIPQDAMTDAGGNIWGPTQLLGESANLNSSN